MPSRGFGKPLLFSLEASGAEPGEVSCSVFPDFDKVLSDELKTFLFLAVDIDARM